MSGSSLYGEECIELNTVWDIFYNKYSEILDPALIDVRNETFHKFGRPPYKIIDSKLNEAASEKIQDFLKRWGNEYKQEWIECYRLEKNVCSTCLLNKQIALLKRLDRRRQ